jgi:hypothetical protein
MIFLLNKQHLIRHREKGEARRGDPVSLTFLTRTWIAALALLARNDDHIF